MKKILFLKENNVLKVITDIIAMLSVYLMINSFGFQLSIK